MDFSTEEERCRRFAIGVGELVFDPSIEIDMFRMVVLDRALHLLVNKRDLLKKSGREAPVTVGEADVFPGPEVKSRSKSKNHIGRLLDDLVAMRFLRRIEDGRWATNFCELVDVVERMCDAPPRAEKEKKKAGSLRVVGGFVERKYECRNCFHEDVGRSSESLAPGDSKDRTKCPSCGQETLERKRSSVLVSGSVSVSVSVSGAEDELRPLRELLTSLRRSVRTPERFASADDVERMQTALN